jgi:HEAT repeat protein
MEKRKIIWRIIIAFIVFAGIQALPELRATESEKGMNEAGKDISLNRLIAELRDPDPKVRGNAVEQLGKIKYLDAVDYLTLILEYDDDWSVRKRAAWALGEIKDGKAVGPLIEALQHKDWIIRFNAAEALGKIGDGRAVEPLIETLRDENSHVYGQVTWALGEICDVRAVKPLTEALGNEIPAVRINAAKALGKIKSSQAIEALIVSLREDRIWEVRKWSAWAMGEIKDSRAVDSLINALKDENYYVRMHAELSLEKTGRPAVPLLIAALKDKQHQLRTRVAWALEEITGQNYGSDAESWRKWLRENRGTFPGPQ